MFVFPDQGNEILRYCDHIIEELQQLDAEQWCIDKGFGKLQAFVLIAFIETEILGDTKQ